ncbi:REDY-like protein HapK [Pelagerythrobacter marinus]|nr:REDY-like protein HapK [Pelagerythrobacter marinus]
MRIIVLFNLKEGVDPAAYEEWARTTDIPGVRGLKSVEDFQVYRATGLFGSDATPPYAYFEVIDITGIDAFEGDASSEAVQKVAAEFQQFADNPLFVTTEAL